MLTLHYLELVNGKNYFNLIKIFVLKLFKMATVQIERSRLEHMSVSKFLLAEKCKPWEIKRTLCDGNKEACFGKKCLQIG